MLTLKNFALQISNAIVHRGREYYENGAVVDLDEIEADFWHAGVKGSDIYTVEVKLFRKDKIKSYSCDCPYEGDVCKHVVAVLFLLREQQTNNAILKKGPPKNDFKGLLQKISLEEYQEFILAHAARDRKFKSLFERHFADKDSGINVDEKYTKLLRSLIENNSRGDFIDYRSVHQLANEINELLDEGRELLQKRNFRNAFILVRSVLIEVIELITYCDDSSGYIGDIIHASIELIVVIAEAEKVAADLLEELFDFVGSAIDSPVYFDYGDFAYSMVDVYYTLAIKLSKEKMYLDFIDARLKEATVNEFSYRKDYFLVRKIDFLRATGNVSDAEKLVRKNLNVVNVRRGEVSRLIEKNEFHSAKKLIVEGIEIARKKDHLGTVKEWEEELLRVAVLENDKEKIRHYTKLFAFDGGFDLGYYNQWKNTFSVPEWEEEIEKYIGEKIASVEQQYQKNKSSVWYSPDTLLLDLLSPIYIEEKYWDRLLALMSRETDLDRLLRYHNYLIKIYPVQLLAIYIPAFERKGDVVGNRREYANLAINMEKVIRAIPEGKDKIIAVAEEINRKYPRRPAMIAELNSVIKMRDLK
jgi:uncharacterized Zn finger protein